MLFHALHVVLHEKWTLRTLRNTSIGAAHGLALNQNFQPVGPIIPRRSLEIGPTSAFTVAVSPAF
jgi:hypothetical protein